MAQNGKWHRVALAAWGVALLVAAGAQAAEGGPGSARVKVADVAPRPSDVQTLDGIIGAFYEVVSGPAGQPREWARDRTLYIPGIRFVIVVPRKDGKADVEVQTHQEYVDSNDARMVKDGFFESEIHRDTRSFGNIVHVFSTYEVRKTKEGPVLGRGVNSIELLWDGARWWIASATWEPETSLHPLPKDLLPGG
jgi:hypothetical protein